MVTLWLLESVCSISALLAWRSIELHVIRIVFMITCLFFWLLRLEFVGFCEVFSLSMRVVLLCVDVISTLFYCFFLPGINFCFVNFSHVPWNCKKGITARYKNGKNWVFAYICLNFLSSFLGLWWFFLEWKKDWLS